MIAIWLALSAWSADICLTGCTFASVQEAVDAIPVGGSAVHTIGGGYLIGPTVIDGQRRVTLLSLSPDPAVLTASVTDPAVITVTDGSSLSLTGISVIADGVRGIDVSGNSTLSLILGSVSGGGPVGEGALIRLRESSLDTFAVGLGGGSSTGEGGAILAIDSDVDIEGTVLANNTAAAGGSLLARATGTRRSIVIAGSTVLSSNATSDGGGVAFRGEVDVVLDTVVFQDTIGFRGGSIAVLGDGPEVSIHSGIVDNVVAVESGGFLYQSGGNVFVDTTSIQDPVAYEGAAVSLAGGNLTLEAFSVRRGISANRGGAVLATGGELSLRGFFLEDCLASEGGGLWLGPSVVASEVVGGFLCRNVAILGAGALIGSSDDVAIRATRVIDNHAFVDGGGLLHQGAGELELSAVNLLGNTSAAGGAAGVSTLGSLAVSDALIAHHSGGVAIRRGSDTPVSYGGGTVWWENDRGDGDDLQPTTPGAHYLDPMLNSYAPGDDCAHIQDYGSWYGPMRDTGSEDLQDPDGSRADIGAFGGPYADLAVWNTDADADGMPILYDCDELDPDTHPLADDPPYDGRDTDCDGADDFDADGDGFRPTEHGGADCDDARADVFPGAEELASEPPVDMNCDGRFDADDDGFEPPEDCDDSDPDAFPGAVDNDPNRDLDCDGFVDSPQLIRPVSCDTTGGSGAQWLALALGLTARARSRRRSPE